MHIKCAVKLALVVVEVAGLPRLTSLAAARVEAVALHSILDQHAPGRAVDLQQMRARV